MKRRDLIRHIESLGLPATKIPAKIPDMTVQATEIAPTEGIRKSDCGPFVLCR